MDYKVIITPPAKHRLEMYIGYTLRVLKNPQGAKSIAEDAVATRKKLENVAGSIRLCSNPILAEHGYRKMHFLKHDFLMIYRIVENHVIVDGMFHELQDYEAVFIDEMKLNK